MSTDRITLLNKCNDSTDTRLHGRQFILVQKFPSIATYSIYPFPLCELGRLESSIASHVAMTDMEVKGL